MKKMIKSYLVLASKDYQVVSMIVLPVLNLILAGFLLRVKTNPSPLLESFLFAFVVGQKVLLDNRIFGGICSRDGSGLEYMKTSNMGVSVLKRGIAADLLCHFVYLMGFGLYCFAFTGCLYDLLIALLAYTLNVCAMNAARYSVVMQMHIMIGIVASVLLSVAAMLCFALGEGRRHEAGILAAEFIVTAILAVAVSIATMWHMAYCVRGSYYEK